MSEAAGPFDNGRWVGDSIVPQGFPAPRVRYATRSSVRTTPVIGIPRVLGKAAVLLFPRRPRQAYRWLLRAGRNAASRINNARIWRHPHSHHVFKEWADKEYRGEFDDGWDVYRRRHSNGKSDSGSSRPELTRAARPIPRVGRYVGGAKTALARQMECSPGSRKSGWNVGRCWTRSKDLGESDNTVFYIWGDNGASMRRSTNTSSFNRDDVPLTAWIWMPSGRLIEHNTTGIAALSDGFTTATASAWAHASNTACR